MAKKRKRLAEQGAEAFTTLIERDFTALAKEGRLPVGHGLDGPVGEVLSLLSRGGKAPLLSGEQGVGKSAIVQELARRVVAGLGGEALLGYRIVEVTIAGVFARTSTPKASAELFEELLDELGRQRCVVFIRDVALVQGTSLVPVLIRSLRSGVARFVFECDERRANDLLRSDEAFAERVHVISVTEPTLERARWILGRVAEELETELTVPIEPGACDMALRLSTKFLLARRLPRTAIELLKETAVEVAGAAKERVAAEDVLARFCASTRLPRFMADDAMPLDLSEMQQFFGARLLGQTDAVAAVLRSVALLKAGLNDPKRPLGVFLFCGPTGVGKTHLAKLLAEYLFGAADRLVRLNMADYQHEAAEEILFGNPWAQSTEGKRGELSRLLDGKVFSVLLLDEFEKANPRCHDRFLQLFDEGQFINAARETVPCNNTLIVATSNVGAEVYREPPVGFSGRRSAEELLHEIDRRIATAFRAEFLNRFDALCHFQPLSRVEIRRIAQREVGRVLERDGIRARGLEVEVAAEVVDLLTERGYSATFGARFLKREIEKSLTAALAVEIARRPLPPGTPVKVVAHKGRVEAIAEPKQRREVKPTAQAQLPVGAGGRLKKLDQRALIAEAESLIGKSAAVASQAGRVGLESRRRELLAQSQAPGFWENGEQAAATLRAFRAVEAKLQELERLRDLCMTARRRAREAKGDVQLSTAARAVEEAAREVQLAEARLAAGVAGDADEAWVDICASSDAEAAASWVRELSFLYQSWGERRRYEVKALAEGAEPHRVVLQVTGPGVYGFLAGERGVHRRVEDQSRVSATVRLLRPSHAPLSVPGSFALEGREVKRRPGVLLERVASEAAATDEATGRALSLSGAGEVSELKRLLVALLEAPNEPSVEVRRYFMGRGARVEDPRTGEGTPRVKDVMRGEIDLFIAAWLARPPPEA